MLIIYNRFLNIDNSNFKPAFYDISSIFFLYYLM